MQGNTDTIQYWNLTRNIYRFSPTRQGEKGGVHAGDEHMGMVAHLEGMQLYYGKLRSISRAWCFKGRKADRRGDADLIRNFDGEI